MKKHLKELQSIKAIKKINALYPVYDNALSFYNKALVYNDDEHIILYSYLTPVCIIDKNNNVYAFNSDIDIELLLSNTTLRHIKEFLKQYFKNDNYTKKHFDKLINGSINYQLKNNYDASLCNLLK